MSKKQVAEKKREYEDCFYILGLKSEKEKRAAWGYEVFRESDKAQKLIDEARAEQKGFTGIDRMRWRALPQIQEAAKIIGWDFLGWIVECPNWPQKSFKEMCPLTNAQLDELPFLGEAVRKIGWEEIGLLILRAGSLEKAIKLLKMYGDIMALSFPPGSSNIELANSFKTLLDEIRPEGIRKVNSLGRGGGINNRGLPDLVRQLTAYRLKTGKKTWEDLPSPPKDWYGSKYHFDQGAKRMHNYISQILEKPLL